MARTGPDSSYTVGREGNAITLIVDHWTVAMFEGAIRRFLDPASILSAHYVIGQDGRIAHLVSEDDTAYHACKFDVNLRSIGIVPTEYPGTLDLDRIVRDALQAQERRHEH